MTEQHDNMSNTAPETTVTSSERRADGPNRPTEGNDTGEPQNGSQRQNKEARYRVERNEAREALATAEARIAQFQRAEVERLASESLAMPGDLLTLSGNELSEYLDDDGNVDPEKVAADVAVILAERPGIGKAHPRAFDPTQGHGGRHPSKQAPSWGALFQ
jgi:hypothetical protein